MLVQFNKAIFIVCIYKVGEEEGRENKIFNNCGTFSTQILQQPRKKWKSIFDVE